MSKIAINNIINSDIPAISRSITKIENSNMDNFLSDLYPYTGNAFRIGITGPPGAGKSTITNKLIHEYRKYNKKVGVIVIDPTSPFTGGALLGDRIRMLDHYKDPQVFIRSMASRNSQGGLSEKAHNVADVLDAAGFDIIIFETLGVGQVELDIIQTADSIIVILVPESGDDVQMMKAGLMEIADIFIINKSDRDGANKLETTIRHLLSIDNNKIKWEIPVIKTIATKGTGIKSVYRFVNEHYNYIDNNDIIKKKNKLRYKYNLNRIISNMQDQLFWTKSKKDILNKILKKNCNEWPSPLILANKIMHDV